MAKFAFDLDPVLEHRRRVERQRQREVAELETARRAIEERVQTVRDHALRAREDARARLGPADDAPGGAPVLVAVDQVRFGAAAGLHAVVLLQRAAIELAGIHQRLASARERLNRTVTDRKAIETLRTRRFEAWKLEQSRREVRALDDLAVMRYARTDQPTSTL
jgi:flagellar biosynthesis chaperone FliJ